MPPPLSRRSLLQCGVAATAVGLSVPLAGCGRRSGEGDTGGGDTARLDAVPAGVDAVLDVDVAGLLGDVTLRETGDQFLAGGDDSRSVEAVLDAAEDRTGLDPRALREVLVFATHEGSVGGVFRTDWSKSAVFEAFQSRAGAVTETTRGDRPVLAATAGTDGAVGVLEDGVFAAGTAATVEAVRDCWRGDADPVGGDVREAFGNAGSGYARFGFDVPVGKIPAETGTLLDAGPLKELTYGYGSLREDRTLAVALRATGGAAATDVASILESGLALAREEARTAPESPRTERLRRVLAETAVESRDRTVTVRTASGVSALLVALETLAPSFLPGVGPARGRPTPPAVSVAVEYDPAARELVVVHEAGDFVPAGELYIRGEGVPTGRWDDLGGSTSVESGGHPAVAAGDRLVVPAVPPEYTVRLVWEARGDEARAVLVEHRGPGV